MYTPPAFSMDDRESIQAFIAGHPFAILVSPQDPPLITHVPIYQLDNGKLYGHLAAANPHANVAEGSVAAAIFNGPHAYISPMDYASESNVPTWNYSAVHATGRIQFVDDPEEAWNLMQTMVRRTEGEDGWQLPDEKRYRGMLKALRFFTIEKPSFQGKQKYNQNKQPEDVQAVIQSLCQQGRYHVAEAMAAANRIE